jgi:hypothetical protein
MSAMRTVPLRAVGDLTGRCRHCWASGRTPTTGPTCRLLASAVDTGWRVVATATQGETGTESGGAPRHSWRHRRWRSSRRPDIGLRETPAIRMVRRQRVGRPLAA